MKTNFRIVLFLIGVLLIVSNSFALAHTNVTAQQARDIIDSTDDLVVLDVREPYEYCGATGHIQGALNYPWNSGVLQARYEELPMHVPVLVVCGSGGRSNSAANFLDSKDFSIVYDMLRGMNAWLWDTVPCKYGGGSGTVDDPYQIATAEDLMLLGEMPEDYNKHFILTNDIDLDPNLPFDRAIIAPDTGGDGYTFPGTSFTGVFDGNGHAVSHLTITGKSYLGLFGQVGPEGQVKGLGVVDVNITGSYYAIGGLVGDNLQSSITTCYSTGTVTGYTFVGGLVGYNNYGDIAMSYSNCAASATSSGNQAVGGLVGVSAGSITTSYSSGDVSGQRSVGGLVGWNYQSNITNSYSTGKVSGDQDVGGLVGIIDQDGDMVTGCFWDLETSGQAESAGGTGKTTAEMQTESTFTDAGWDFVGETENGTDDLWWILEGTDYPRLWWERDEAEQSGVIELDETNFDALIADGVVLVDFYATWCPHCTTQAPILEEVAGLVQGWARVAKLDVDNARAITQRYEVNAIPTLILFRDGLEVQRFVGVTSADILVAAILSAVDS